jgi:GAF domain-containing protein
MATCERRILVTAVSSEEDQVDALLAALSQPGAGHLPLDQALGDVAALAARLVPGADGAGLAISRPDLVTISATAPFVTTVDQLQTRVGEGPLILAARTSKPVRTGALSEDDRWPALRPRAVELGVNSAMSIPFVAANGDRGVLTVYAQGRDAFDERARSLAELIAAPAAIAVQNAQVLARTKELLVELKGALERRAVIDRAIGVMAARNCYSEQQALGRLLRMSVHEGQDLYAMARSVVDDALRQTVARFEDGAHRD